MDTTIIVFYSKDNNTRTAASILGKEIEAKTLELKEIKKGSFIQALFKKGSRLVGSPWSEIKPYSRIYLMSPIWASNGVPAMNTFLDKADFTEKEVIIVTLQQFEDLKNSDKVHEHIKEKVAKSHGAVLHCHALLGGKMGHFAGEDFIKEQVQKLLAEE